MKKATLQHDDKRADILALLEERPYEGGELAQLLRIQNGVLAQVCKRMKRDGLVKRTGTQKKWALASYVASVGRPHLTSPAKAQRAAAKADEEPESLIPNPELEAGDVDVDEDAIAADELLDAPRRVPGRPAKALRQPYERPESASVKKDAPRAWWVGLSRDEFQKAAATRAATMRTARENTFVPFRTLQ